MITNGHSVKTLNDSKLFKRYLFIYIYLFIDFIFFNVILLIKVFAEDNEENALTSLRIIFDLHKSFRPSLENHVQVR